MICYSIKNWSSTFEKSDSRKAKSLTWVSIPTDLAASSGYQELIASHATDAAEVYGAWIAVVVIASQCRERGVLKAGNGKPYTVERLAQMTFLPVESIKKMLDFTTRDDVGWMLREIIPTASGQHPDGIPTTPGDHPDGVPTASRLQDRTRQDRTEQDKTEQSCGEVSPRSSYPNDFEAFWSEYPKNASGRKVGKKTTFAHWKRIHASDRELLLQATRNYAAEQKEFIRDPERFLKADWWRDWIESADRSKSALDEILDEMDDGPAEEVGNE